ncbi:MAG: FAD-binding oxidoreductase [Acidimicrobiia bacterium]|nr:FAD-binding oxidoreductase [Acidimicrobiia bacterium]
MMLHQEMARLAKGLVSDPVAGAPDADITLAPTSAEDAASVLGFAAEHSLPVRFWGGGTHQGMGYPVVADILMSTHRMSSIVDWQVDDLTVTVQPGVLIADLEGELQQRRQTAVLQEVPGQSTVGGAVAAGLSGWRRLRYGPTRDRALEVRLATGDGRLIRGGGRLVKNVTGYDLPRLATGSFGSLGLITEMCLKLWPLPPEHAMVPVQDAERALALAYRPLALIETNAGATLYLSGSREELEAQAERVGGDLVSGHRWPQPLVGAVEATLRVPPSAVAQLVEKLRAAGIDFQAAHGVGEIRLVGSLGELAELRDTVEATGGALVIGKIPKGADFDPWGKPPEGIDLQRRVKAAFDPRSVANPGILPGGI